MNGTRNGDTNGKHDGERNGMPDGAKSSMQGGGVNDAHIDVDQRTAWASKVMVALDFATAQEAEQTIGMLEGSGCYLKVGMQLFYTAGPRWVEQLKAKGYSVFLDLKLHDIPNTVKGGAQSITRLGVDMFNVHAAGGKAMMEAALEGVEKGLVSQQNKPIVIGVTHLTSTDQATLNEEIGIPGRVEENVLRYAQLAHTAGLQGVVSSPLEVPMIKSSIGKAFITVTPGVRPVGGELADQRRVTTPKDAFLRGTDYVVIGRPITQAADPRQALELILDEISMKN